MAYPTTLALITALWSGPGAHASDRAVVGPRRRDRRARAADRRARCCEHFGWGSVFLRHAAAGGGRARAWRGASCRRTSTRRPTGRQPRRHPLGRARRRAGPRDQLRARARTRATLALVLGGIALAAGVALRPPPAARREPAVRPATSPARRIFWVAACAGIIVFGSLMGAMFVGQQFLQNVLGYSTLEAGAAILPAASAWCWSRRARRSSSRRAARASRCCSATCSACSAS